MNYPVRHTPLLRLLSLVLCISIGHTSSALAQAPMCAKIFTAIITPGNQAGAQFLLQRKQPDHTAPQVTRATKQFKQHSGETLTKPLEKIQAMLNRYDAWFKKYQDDPKAKNLLAESFYKEFVIKKNEIPDNYYELQARIHRETGRGELNLNRENRNYLAEVVIADQKHSLKSWMDFVFFSNETRQYPMWAKIWAFQGVAKLGKFDLEKGAFAARTKGQTAPFPNLNKEAFLSSIDAVVAKVDGQGLEKITDPVILKQLAGANFGKIYGRAVFIEVNRQLETLSIKGKWVKYDRGSDAQTLVDALACKNTGWCTTNLPTAKNQLRDGDFYVFYSLNNKNQATEPRIAIRMDGDEIGEIRGIGKDQNLDSQIVKTNILEAKLKDFGAEGAKYLKRTHDMKLLGLIEQKQLKDLPLSKDEILFLYELNGEITGFGWEKDPRIDAIISQRNKIQDLAFAFEINESEITVSKEAFQKSTNVKIHVGTLDLGEIKLSAKKTLPDVLFGSLYATDKPLKDFRMPLKMSGDCFFNDVPSIKNAKFPEVLKGEVNFESLIKAEGLFLPKIQFGGVTFDSLRSAKGVTFATTQHGNIHLGGLTTYDGLALPKEMYGDIYIFGPAKAKNLQMPEIMNGSTSLRFLTSAEGVIFSKVQNGSLILHELKTIKGLVLPKEINGGDLALSGLTSADGLVLPIMKKGQKVFLHNLESAKGLVIHEDFSGGINLSKIKSLDGLVVPKNFKGRFKFGKHIPESEIAKLGLKPEQTSGDLD